MVQAIILSVNERIGLYCMQRADVTLAKTARWVATIETLPSKYILPVLTCSAEPFFACHRTKQGYMFLLRTSIANIFLVFILCKGLCDTTSALRSTQSLFLMPL